LPAEEQDTAITEGPMAISSAQQISVRAADCILSIIKKGALKKNENIPMSLLNP